VKKLGLLAAVGYILTIVGANYAIGHWGNPTFPGGPHVIPVGFGYTAPSGVLFVSLALITRDIVQWAMGRPAKPRPVDIAAMLALIGVGVGVSFGVAAPAVAIASAIAFGSTLFWQGQVLGKSYGIILAALVVAARRVRFPRAVTA
jgi:hypothetical protein